MTAFPNQSLTHPSEPLLRTVDDFAPEDWQTLICPQCGWEYTHVDEVTMEAASNQPAITLSASGEDHTAAISIIHGGEEVQMPGRRHSMVIRISCEDGCVTDLELAQHKGNTYTMIRPIIHTPAT